MKRENILRVAITGPESSGKSTLAKQLALHFNTVWVPEFARTYIEKLGREYKEEDLLEIAQGQLEQEKLNLKLANSMIFCDTELLVIKIWSLYKYNRVHPWIQSSYSQSFYDLYLVCKPDLIWEEDHQRENPNKGEYFFGLFKDELDRKKANYEIVCGNGDIRLKKAIEIIKKNLGI